MYILMRYGFLSDDVELDKSEDINSFHYAHKMTNLKILSLILATNLRGGYVLNLDNGVYIDTRNVLIETIVNSLLDKLKKVHNGSLTLDNVLLQASYDYLEIRNENLDERIVIMLSDSKVIYHKGSSLMVYDSHLMELYNSED